MADNKENSPVVSDEVNTPDKRVNSTPSSERSGGSPLPYLLYGDTVESPQAVLVVPVVSLTLHRVKTVTPESRTVYRHSAHKKHQVPAQQDTSNNTPPKHEGDEYVRFDTETKARHKLDLTKDMVKYVNDKFTTYVKDKSIRE